jgi:capsular polysaccharide biosynthesis protein
MSPGEWFGAIRRAWLGMLTIFVLSVLASGAMLLVTPATYEAEAEIVFGAGDETATFVPRTIATNAAVRARSESVIASVADEFDLSRRELADSVSATWRPETSITAVTVSHTDPGMAAALATSIAETVADETGSDARARTFEAVTPESPVRPRAATALPVGALVGIALAVAYAGLRFVLSRRVRSLEDAAELTSLPAYAWPNGEATPEQMRDLHLIMSAWAGDDSVIVLLPLDAAVDTSPLARAIEAGSTGLTVTQRPPLQEGPVDIGAVQPGEALVLVAKIGSTDRHSAQALGRWHREGSARVRGVIVIDPATTRRRAMSAVGGPAHGGHA